ncbi:MAG: hypothetical protein LBN34_04370 [Clostridiales Family XIII bacterium]|jgi:hypothetical protein|nr:hypothetical protein [Clostridiales Family XIII bacterium]
MKNILIVALTLLIAVSFSACNKEKDKDKDEATETPTQFLAESSVTARDFMNSTIGWNSEISPISIGYCFAKITADGKDSWYVEQITSAEVAVPYSSDPILINDISKYWSETSLESWDNSLVVKDKDCTLYYYEDISSEYNKASDFSFRYINKDEVQNGIPIKYYKKFPEYEEYFKIDYEDPWWEKYNVGQQWKFIDKDDGTEWVVTARYENSFFVDIGESGPELLDVPTTEFRLEMIGAKIE